MATSQAAFVDEKVDGIAGACGALRSWCAMVRLRESSQASPSRHWWLSHAGPAASPAKICEVICWVASCCVSQARCYDISGKRCTRSPRHKGVHHCGVLPADAIDSDRWCNDGDDEEDDPDKQ